MVLLVHLWDHSLYEKCTEIKQSTALYSLESPGFSTWTFRIWKLSLESGDLFNLNPQVTFSVQSSGVRSWLPEPEHNARSGVGARIVRGYTGGSHRRTISHHQITIGGFNRGFYQLWWWDVVMGMAISPKERFIQLLTETPKNARGFIINLIVFGRKYQIEVSETTPFRTDNPIWNHEKKWQSAFTKCKSCFQICFLVIPIVFGRRFKIDLMRWTLSSTIRIISYFGMSSEIQNIIHGYVSKYKPNN